MSTDEQVESVQVTLTRPDLALIVRVLESAVGNIALTKRLRTFITGPTEPSPDAMELVGNLNAGQFAKVMDEEQYSRFAHFLAAQAHAAGSFALALQLSEDGGTAWFHYQLSQKPSLLARIRRRGTDILVPPEVYLPSEVMTNNRDKPEEIGSVPVWWLDSEP